MMKCANWLVPALKEKVPKSEGCRSRCEAGALTAGRARCRWRAGLSLRTRWSLQQKRPANWAAHWLRAGGSPRFRGSTDLTMRGCSFSLCGAAPAQAVTSTKCPIRQWASLPKLAKSRAPATEPLMSCPSRDLASSRQNTLEAWMSRAVARATLSHFAS